MSAGEARRASILVVDDEPTISEVVARYLDRAGYAVRTAADGPGGGGGGERDAAPTSLSSTSCSPASMGSR